MAENLKSGRKKSFQTLTDPKPSMVQSDWWILASFYPRDNKSNKCGNKKGSAVAVSSNLPISGLNVFGLW